MILYAQSEEVEGWGENMGEDPKNSGSLTFSILIEAENVVTAGLKGLRECLDTLKAQDIYPGRESTAN
jgi:hypothetical protein